MKASIFAALVAGAMALVPDSGVAEVMSKLGQEQQLKRQELADKGLLKTVQVSTQYGPIVGNAPGLFGNTNAFLGIPFAQQPINGLRWKAPQPLSGNWPGDGTLDATNFRACCPNPEGEKWWTYYGGEDEGCLHLNIYTPANAGPDSNLPVMFFVHGGSWVYGSGSFIMYHGYDIIDNGNNVILVTINYRLGPFGFLAGDLLKSESPDGSAGNYGFQDQQMALKWVHDNIASFGGDPTQVLLFGESAGGASVSLHLSSPASWPYFNKAIIESGAWSDWSTQPWAISSTRLPQMSNNLGCSDEPDQLACMRSKDYNTVMNADDATVTKGFLEWGPTIDGVVFPEDPRIRVKNGQIAPVPIIIGFNQDEGTVFNDFPVNMTASDFVPAVIQWSGENLSGAIVNQYPLSSYSSPWWALTNVLGDSQILCPAQLDAAALANLGHQVFVYFYSHTLYTVKLLSQLTGKPLGCFHGSELFLVFNGVPALLIGAGESSLSKLMQRYWANFATSGNPNNGNDPVWPSFTSSGKMMQLDTNPSQFTYNVTLIDGVKPELCGFWSNITISSNHLYG